LGPTNFKVFTVDFVQLNSELNGLDIPHRNDLISNVHVLIQLPNAAGSFDTYRVVRNTTMHPELAAAYPEIRTFDVLGVSDRNKSGKIDVTPHGFHAMIFDRVNGTFLLIHCSAEIQRTTWFTTKRILLQVRL